ncbi:MAG TPA: hypothetical protein VFO16_12425, partial [Pseudonocardiaceae bacterium]|nr:hypothetical protein [Pseudonocardiaceae bacterium]
MPTIAVFRFPGGRYHAPPWSRAGTVELPPSPWRLLREFHAVWRTRAPELGEETVHPLLARLAEPPTVHVPWHTVVGGVAVFDRDAELALRWPFELDPAQHAALERLVSSIPYLGQADNACSGSLSTGWEPGSHDTWVPVDVAESVSAAPTTTVLAPELPLRFGALLNPPVEVRRGGLPFPAGTHLVPYQRRPREEMVTAVRYRVSQTVLPPQTESLIYTDLLHRGALSKLGVLRAHRAHTLLGGRRADGKTMEGHHHAHYLPLITGRRVSGLVVWVPGELPADEL